MNETYYMIQAMKRWGGSFVKNLAFCFETADSDNMRRLFVAFPEYVEKYQTLGKTLPRE